MSCSPWYNLSKQQYQPNMPWCQSDEFIELIVNARKKEAMTDNIIEEAMTDNIIEEA